MMCRTLGCMNRQSNFMNCGRQPLSVISHLDRTRFEVVSHRSSSPSLDSCSRLPTRNYNVSPGHPKMYFILIQILPETLFKSCHLLTHIRKSTRTSEQCSSTSSYEDHYVFVLRSASTPSSANYSRFCLLLWTLRCTSTARQLPSSRELLSSSSWQGNSYSDRICC